MLCFEKTRNSLVVFLEGDIDHMSAAVMRAEIDNQLRDIHIRELTLDVDGVSFMDSSGIGLVLGRYRIMNERGGCVIISRPARRTDKLFKMAGVYDLVERRI